MSRPRKVSNLGVERGAWGESVASEYLRRAGFVIVDRNVRPVERDERLEVDIIAWDPERDEMTFVEVKQHADLTPYGRRLRSVDRRKQQNLLLACNAWRRINKWAGACRFDVIEIYGVPGGGKPVIDHIPNVRLFAKPERFVNWN